jgi:hypothetical protein
MQHQAFLRAFAEAFARHWAETHAPLDVYKTSALWTDFMFGSTSAGRVDGVLPSAARDWADAIGVGQEQGSVHAQWYTVDLVLVSPPYRGDGRYWLSRTLLALEHEKASDVETELWKLAHWRADLSVLVLYDYSDAELDRGGPCDDPQLPGVTKREWLARKLERLSEIVRLVDAKDAARHLLLIGGRVDAAPARVTWRFSRWNGDGFSAPAPIEAAAA